MSAVERWVAAGPDVPATHVLLGPPYGRLAVPDEELAAFRRATLTDVRHGVSPGITEVLTDPLRYFVDLDFAALGEVAWRRARADPELVCRIVAVARKTAGVLFPLAEHTTYVAEAHVPDEDAAPGIHLHWPTTCVGASDAFLCARFIAAALADDDVLRTLGASPAAWSKFVDPSVYKGVGRGALRMLFQDKWSRKPEPARVGRAYTYTGKMEGATDMTIILSTIAGDVSEEEHLQWTSTRAATADIAVRTETVVRRAAAAAPRVVSAIAGPLVDRESLRPSDPRFVAAQAWIRKATGKADVLVSTVKQMAQRVAVTTNLLFCPNAGREHQWRTQYFLFFPSKVTRRCGCKCTDKTCAAWKQDFSGAEQYPAETARALFPNRERPQTASQRRRAAVDSAVLRPVGPPPATTATAAAAASNQPPATAADAAAARIAALRRLVGDVK